MSPITQAKIREAARNRHDAIEILEDVANSLCIALNDVHAWLVETGYVMRMPKGYPDRLVSLVGQPPGYGGEPKKLRRLDKETAAKMAAAGGYCGEKLLVRTADGFAIGCTCRRWYGYAEELEAAQKVLRKFKKRGCPKCRVQEER